MKCPNCGNEITGKFCTSCGTEGDYDKRKYKKRQK